MTREQLLKRWATGSREFKAACIMVGGFLLIRAGYSHTARAWLIGVGLSAAELAAIVALDAAAKRYHEKKADWRAECGGITQLEKRAAAAEHEGKELDGEIQFHQSELDDVTRKIQLRVLHNFDRDEVSKAAIEHAHAGYREGIERNRMNHSSY
jgi:hypothetical protein